MNSSLVAAFVCLLPRRKGKEEAFPLGSCEQCIKSKWLAGEAAHIWTMAIRVAAMRHFRIQKASHASQRGGGSRQQTLLRAGKFVREKKGAFRVRGIPSPQEKMLLPPPPPLISLSSLSINRAWKRKQHHGGRAEGGRMRIRGRSSSPSSREEGEGGGAKVCG